MKILRLNSSMRRFARMDRSDAGRMHVVLNNSVIPAARYNLKSKTGDLYKITVGEKDLRINVLKKIGKKYQQSMSHIFNSNDSEKINKCFADIVEFITKK